MSIAAAAKTVSIFGSKAVYVIPEFVGGYLPNKNFPAYLYELNRGASLEVDYVTWGTIDSTLVNDIVTYGGVLYGTTVSINSTNFYFKVSNIYVTVPTTYPPRQFDSYFQVSFLAIDCSPNLIPCNQYSASEVNTGYSLSVTALDYQLEVDLLDYFWLAYKVSTTAIVQGYVYTYPYDTNYTAASIIIENIFLELPDRTTDCIAIDPIVCPTGEVFAYYMDETRCLQVNNPACIPELACPTEVPTCVDGYYLSQFASEPNGCDTYYCFPNFVNDT